MSISFDPPLKYVILSGPDIVHVVFNMYMYIFNRYMSRDVRLERLCFPRWQGNKGATDIRTSLPSPFCTSLFPVYGEREVRKHLLYGLSH